MSGAPKMIIAMYCSQDVEYRRADIPWLPDELVERLRDKVEYLKGNVAIVNGVAAGTIILLRDILAALEEK